VELRAGGGFLMAPLVDSADLRWTRLNGRRNRSVLYSVREGEKRVRCEKGKLVRADYRPDARHKSGIG
jgi:hypothetical protein